MSERRHRALAAGALAVILIAVTLAVVLSGGGSDESAPGGPPEGISAALSRQDVRALARERGLGSFFWMGPPRGGGQVRADLNESSFLGLAYLSGADVRALDEEPLGFTTLLTSSETTAKQLESLKKRLRKLGASWQKLRGPVRAAVVRDDRGVIKRVILIGSGRLIGELIPDSPPIRDERLQRELESVRQSEL